MKSKVVGYIISAAFVVLVVYVAFRITAVRNLILGTPASSS
jgi:hypothetical protein